MRKWLREHVGSHLIRPIIYKTLSYLPTALVLAILWKRFIDRAGVFPMSYAYTVIGVVFLASAWFSYLRLDGVNLSLMKLLPIGTPRKRSSGPSSSMVDHIDVEIVSFAELSEEERATCRLLASVICSIIFFVFSVL